MRNPKTTEFFFASLIMTLLALSCSTGYKPLKIEGNAMLPNFSAGDLVLVRNGEFEIHRGDVIFFRFPRDKDKLYFKRVVGLPGEVISVREGRVLVNNQELSEPYVDETYDQIKGTYTPVLVESGHYYVLGDNRDNSSDSRNWGTVSGDSVVGKFHMTYWHSQ